MFTGKKKRREFSAPGEMGWVMFISDLIARLRLQFPNLLCCQIYKIWNVYACANISPAHIATIANQWLLPKVVYSPGRRSLSMATWNEFFKNQWLIISHATSNIVNIYCFYSSVDTDWPRQQKITSILKGSHLMNQ